MSVHAHRTLLTVRGTDIALHLTHRPQTLVLRVKRKKLTVFVQAEPTDTVLEVKHKLHDMLSQVRERASRCCLGGGATMHIHLVVTCAGALPNCLLHSEKMQCLLLPAVNLTTSRFLAGVDPFSSETSHGAGTAAMQWPQLQECQSRCTSCTAPLFLGNRRQRRRQSCSGCTVTATCWRIPKPWQT
jgi:hypothetical protein